MTRSPHRALLIYAQNKMPYGLFIADTGTPTHETICTLIDALEDQHITLECPQSLGMYTSVDITPALPARKPHLTSICQVV